jgi:FAD-linked oxidoreductase
MLWRNWARNQQCAPISVARPTTEEELVDIVRRAAARGERVKAVGSGHSFTGVALTDGCLVAFDRYSHIVSSDASKGTVTVQAGMPLHRLNVELRARGLALENLGDIAYQTIAGAISTGTHGTGRSLGGLATQVTGLRLISGDGSLIDCSAETEPAVFHAARVGLGALGMISTVTLRCPPAFNLHAIEAPMPVDTVLNSLDELLAGNDHFEFFWFPHTGWALTKRNNRTDRPISPRSRWQEFRDDILVSNVAFGALCRLGRLRPSLIPPLLAKLPPPSGAEHVDESYKVFASPRLVRFYEMEYAIPQEAAAEALNEVRRYINRSGLVITFPVEMRFVAGDDIPLSMAYGRDTCYIAVHVYQGTHYQQYFEAVEQIMSGYGGRPHWGKLHFQTAETLAPRYPQWDRFQAVRARLDPAGRFSNRYLERVLGLVDGG